MHITRHKQERQPRTLIDSVKSYGVLVASILFFLLVCEVMIFFMRLILG